MLYNKQLFRHKPELGQYGDCHRTCLANMLDLEPASVPNFAVHYDDIPAFYREVDKFLSSKGLAEFTYAMSGTLEDVLNCMQVWNKNQLYILCGKSPRDTNHSVVCRGGKIICDPAIDGGDLVGPASDGYYWISVLTPIL